MTKQNHSSKFTGAFMLILLLIAVGCLPYFVIQRSFMTFQQNVIGILYEKDPLLCEKTVPCLFEKDIFWKPSKEGRDAMIALGYTEKGAFYLFQGSGLNGVFLGALSVQILLALFFFYRMLYLKKLRLAEEHALSLAIRSAKTKEQELSSGNYRFFSEELLYEISDVLQMLRAKEQFLQKKNRHTQMFIENIAHQIKTPLSCISLSLDLMLEEAETGQKERILECFSRLGSIETLMKRLLDIGRLEAGKIILHREPLPMSQLFEECKSALPNGETRIQIVSEIMEQPDRPYYGDYEWLKEAFSNILKNCLEHDDSGRPVLVSLAQTAEGVKITVRDHGPGIAPEDLPYIFDRFYIPKHQKKSHSGIGLNLAKLIIEKHFGILHVQNHTDGGAVFSIVLPVYALKNEKF